MWQNSQPGTYPSDGHLQADTVCCCGSIYHPSPHITCNAFAVADLIKICFKCVFVKEDLELRQNPRRDIRAPSLRAQEWWCNQNAITSFSLKKSTRKTRQWLRHFQCVDPLDLDAGVHFADEPPQAEWGKTHMGTLGGMSKKELQACLL